MHRAYNKDHKAFCDPLTGLNSLSPLEFSLQCTRTKDNK